jgi:hypothetical protein
LEPTPDAGTLIKNEYFTDNFYDISYDSATAPDTGANTYTAVGSVLSFGSVSETTQLKVNSINIKLSGVDTALLASVINYDLVGKRVVIYRSFLNGDTFDTSRTFMLFDGNIKTWNANEKVDSAEISVSVATHWSNWSQISGRVTNNASQQLTTRYGTTTKFRTDRGFQYAAANIGEIKWGPFVT